MSRLSALVWLWLGAALLFIAVVAPAAFAVLPSRALAGLVVGRVLPVLFWSGAVIAVILMAGTTGWRRAAATVMLVASLVAQLGGLCHELTQGLTELAEDDSWARGQCANLQALSLIHI